MDSSDLRECIVGNEEMSHHISFMESDRADMYDLDEPSSTIRSQGKNRGAFSKLFRKMTNSTGEKAVLYLSLAFEHVN